MVRRIVAGCVAALVVGALLGSVSRALMAVVSLAAGQDIQFSWAGTAGILVIYAAAMLPGALLAAATRRPGRWLLLAAGGVFLCLPAVGVASEEVGGTLHFSTAQWLGVSAAGAAVFATIAVLPFFTLRVVDRVLGRAGGSRSPAGVTGLEVDDLDPAAECEGRVPVVGRDRR